MASESFYWEQKSKRQRMQQINRKRKRRIRRLKCYLCRTIVICLFLLIVLGAVLLSRTVNRNKQPGKIDRYAQEKMQETRANIAPFSADSVIESVYDNLDHLEMTGYDKAIIESLIQIAPDNPTIVQILNEIEEYPAELLELVSKNAETADFVLNYPLLSNETKIRDDIDLADSYTAGSIPLFLQWDTRWGYCRYGKNIIALSGCGPTCLSMVYVGLTGDTSKNPGIMSQFSEEQGFLDPQNNTMWALMSEGARALGLFSREVSLDQSVMIQELEEGNPIICSMRPGDFTTTGHFIVLCGYEDGEFIVRDPNSKIRSKKRWDYETLYPQVKNLWAFSL